MFDYMAIAQKYTPAGVTVTYRKALTGMAYPDGRMFAPKPVTRKSLYIYLHECGHFNLGHFTNGKTKRYVEEYEAEKYAHDIMRLEGIPVPKSMTARAKRYVAYKIEQAQKRGLKKLDPKIKQYATK